MTVTVSMADTGHEAVCFDCSFQAEIRDDCCGSNAHHERHWFCDVAGMVQHLQEHRAKGHAVPESILARLALE